MTLDDSGEEGRLPKLVGALALTMVVYWFQIRRWSSRWGTTPEERTRVMPGDALIPNATETHMQAVTVNAPPEDIWPWLVQIGYQRGGLYSYDWLDRLFGFLDRPSATRILPEFQHLAVGDKIPWDARGAALTVGVVEPLRALALSYEDRGFKWVWQFGLYPLDDRRTRFVTRGSEQVPNTPLWWLGMRIMEPAAFIMTRRFLLGVKERAEERVPRRSRQAAITARARTKRGAAMHVLVPAGTERVAATRSSSPPIDQVDPARGEAPRFD